MSWWNQHRMASPDDDGLVLLTDALGHLSWAATSTLILGCWFSPKIHLSFWLFDLLERLWRVLLRLGVRCLCNAVFGNCLDDGVLRVQP
eukprot:6480035-Pyramimonas_sp.AAC.1